MPSPPSSLLSYLRAMSAAWRNDPRDDAELLIRFAESQDESAFATLVWRHGALVWQVCRRILGNTQDAEDAFQATFLALARKASRVTIESLAGWLHRVARQTALNADAGTRRRRNLEHHLRAVTQSLAEDADRAELYAALDEELAGLPERLRVPLLLHYLEGRSQVEVARFLGCARRALQKRLTQGEAVLRERLERRGLAVGIGSVAALLTSSVAVSAVPARLIGSTARAAITFRFGTLTGGMAEGARETLRSLSFSSLESSKFATLAEGMMKTMLVTKMKLVTVLLGVTLCLVGGGLLAYRVLAGNAMESPQSAGETREGAEAPRQSEAAARVDSFGDPLPAHALVRMGTTRLWIGRDRLPLPPLAFSPDGKTLATAIDGMTVCLWDSATGKEIRRLTTKAVKGHFVIWLGFSRDGKTLVTANLNQTVWSRDGKTRVIENLNQTVWWEVATGKFLRKHEYQEPKRKNLLSPTVVFLPDGRMLGFADSFLNSPTEWRGAYVWDVATGKEICQLSEPRKKRERPFDISAFSPDGKILATVVNKNTEEKKATISLWDVATGKELRQLTYEDDCVAVIALSPDGKTLASKGMYRNGICCVWEIATGKKIHLLKVERGCSKVLTYFPDGKTLVVGENGPLCHLFDVGTGKETRSFGCKHAQFALFSPNGKILVTGDKEGAIRLWDIATGKEIGPRKEYRGPIWSVAYSPDGKTLASMGGHETVRLWEAATGKEMRQLGTQTEMWSGSIAYSSDGKMLVSMDHVLHLWDTATGKEIRQFKAGWNPWSATFSPDGKKLVVSESYHKSVHLLEVATGKEIYSLSLQKAVTSGVLSWSVVFSPDGRMLAAPGEGATVSLWEVATGKPIGQLGVPKQPEEGETGSMVRFLAFSPDGRMLAASSFIGEKVRVWEVASGKELYQLAALKPYSREGCALAFSPDGRILATAAQHDIRYSYDPVVHLWEVASGQEIGQLTGHQGVIRTIAFSPDGKTLATGSQDLTCLVWDVTFFTDRLKPTPARPLAAQVLSQKQLEVAWTDLAAEPVKAYAAIRALQAVPAQAIALLQARMRPVPPVADLQQLKRWIGDLDAASFTVRKKAQREIEKLGEPAIPTLRQALKDQPPLEVKRRLQDLLAELEPKGSMVSPRYLREFRAVQVLESIGTAEARRVLQALAKGVPGARLTVEAEVALTRLAKRSAAGP